MQLLDGKKVSTELKNQIKVEVAAMLDKEVRAPHIAAVLVGNDPASETYVRNKEKSAHEVGFVASIYKYKETISEKDLLDVVKFLNDDDELDGYIVQLPLPKHINENRIISDENEITQRSRISNII